MSRRSKRYTTAKSAIEAEKRYSLVDAVKLTKNGATAKFDETITLAVRLGIDAKQTDQSVRGSVVLPNGTGKTVRVLVFAQGEKASEATSAGADMIADDQTATDIEAGKIEFDAVVATPDQMGAVGKLGKILGPRGLMPSPKTGTVTNDVKAAIDSLRAGMVTYRNDKDGNVHAILGKASFSEDAILENTRAIVKSVISNKPQGRAGRAEYLLSLSLAPSMGPSVSMDPLELWDELA